MLQKRFKPVYNTDKNNGGYMNRGDMKAKLGFLEHEKELLIELLEAEAIRVRSTSRTSQMVMIHVEQIENLIEKLKVPDED